MELSLRAKGMDDPEWLKGLIETLPVHLALGSKSNNTDERAGAVAATATGKKWSELSYSQRANLYVKNRDLYEALKAEEKASA
jgi:hypothetical protein